MKKHLKPFIFTALVCIFLLSARESAQAALKTSNVPINDTNFSEELMSYAEDADKNQDGYLSSKEATTVKEISLKSNKNTDIFKGIQHFTEIETFKFDSYIDRRNPEEIGEEEKNTVQKLNLSSLEKLKKVTVECGNTYLKQINLTNCNRLTDVYIAGENQNIQSLDLKQCTNLQKLYCRSISVKKLNLSGYKELEDVDIGGGTIQVLNLKRCPSLVKLFVSSDALTKLKLKDSKNLETAILFAYSLKSVDLSTNTKLKKLVCELPVCPSLDLSRNKELRNFNCSYSEGLREINVNGCKKLRAIRCNHSGIKKLNVKKNTNLQVLLCKQTNIKKLNLKYNRNLKRLECKNTNIKELDLSNTRIRKSSALKCDPDATVTYAQ